MKIEEKDAICGLLNEKKDSKTTDCPVEKG
jgi:hypothetical protein